MDPSKEIVYRKLSIPESELLPSPTDEDTPPLPGKTGAQPRIFNSRPPPVLTQNPSLNTYSIQNYSHSLYSTTLSQMSRTGGAQPRHFSPAPPYQTVNGVDGQKYFIPLPPGTHNPNPQGDNKPKQLEEKQGKLIREVERSLERQAASVDVAQKRLEAMSIRGPAHLRPTPSQPIEIPNARARNDAIVAPRIKKPAEECRQSVPARKDPITPPIVSSHPLGSEPVRVAERKEHHKTLRGRQPVKPDKNLGQPGPSRSQGDLEKEYGLVFDGGRIFNKALESYYNMPTSVQFARAAVGEAIGQPGPSRPPPTEVNREHGAIYAGGRWFNPPYPDYYKNMATNSKVVRPIDEVQKRPEEAMGQPGPSKLPHIVIDGLDGPVRRHFNKPPSSYPEYYGMPTEAKVIRPIDVVQKRPEEAMGQPGPSRPRPIKVNRDHVNALVDTYRRRVNFPLGATLSSSTEANYGGDEAPKRTQKIEQQPPERRDPLGRTNAEVKVPQVSLALRPKCEPSTSSNTDYDRYRHLPGLERPIAWKDPIEDVLHPFPASGIMMPASSHLPTSGSSSRHRTLADMRLADMRKLEEGRRSPVKPREIQPPRHLPTQKKQEDVKPAPCTWWDIRAEKLNRAMPDFSSEQTKRLQRELREEEERGEKEINQSKGLFWGHPSTPEQHVPAVQGLFKHLKLQAPEGDSTAEATKPAPQPKKTTCKGFKFANLKKATVESCSESDNEDLTMPPWSMPAKQELKSTNDFSSDADEEDTAMPDLVLPDPVPILDSPAQEPEKVDFSGVFSTKSSSDSDSNSDDEGSDVARAELGLPWSGSGGIGSYCRRSNRTGVSTELLNEPFEAAKQLNATAAATAKVTAEYKAIKQSSLHPELAELKEFEFEEVELKIVERDTQEEGAEEEDEWIVV